MRWPWYILLLKHCEVLSGVQVGLIYDTPVDVRGQFPTIQTGVPFDAGDDGVGGASGDCGDDRGVPLHPVYIRTESPEGSLYDDVVGIVSVRRLNHQVGPAEISKLPEQTLVEIRALRYLPEGVPASYFHIFESQVLGHIRGVLGQLAPEAVAAVASLVVQAILPGVAKEDDLSAVSVHGKDELGSRRSKSVPRWPQQWGQGM